MTTNNETQADFKRHGVLMNGISITVYIMLLGAYTIPKH